MKKYISTDDLELHLDSTKGSRSYTLLKNLIYEKAKPMIAASDIEKIISNADKIPCHKTAVTNSILTELRYLIKPEPEPKKYGGLTIEEWEQLKKVKLIKVTLYFGAIAADSLLSNVQKISEITKLLPDPEGYPRYHDGSEQPIPDNVIVEVNRKGSKKRSKAIEFDWGFDFGFRVIGVAEDG